MRCYLPIIIVLASCSNAGTTRLMKHQYTEEITQQTSDAEAPSESSTDNEIQEEDIQAVTERTVDTEPSNKSPTEIDIQDRDIRVDRDEADSLPSRTRAYQDSDWIPMGGKTFKNVMFIEEGRNSVVYVADNVAMAQFEIWRLDSQGWSQLGVTIYGTIYSMLVADNGKFYLGGRMARQSGSKYPDKVLRWSGTTWINDDVGISPDATVTSFAQDDRGVIHAGVSDEILKQGTSNWELVARVSGRVSTITFDGSRLYVGGKFSAINGVSANNIAVRNGNSWSAMGSGTSGSNGGVSAILPDGDGQVLAGGYFSIAGGLTTGALARWDGTTWQTAGNIRKIDQWWRVTQLRRDAAGSVWVVGYGELGSVARFTDPSFETVLSKDTSVATVLPQVNQVLLGGDFEKINSLGISKLARYDQISNAFSGFNSGPSGAVSSLLSNPLGSGVYVGGLFKGAGSTAALSIAKYAEGSWFALGQGLWVPGAGTYQYPAAINNIVKHEGTLYAVGGFSRAGSELEASRIARWHGNTWSALGSGIGAYEVFCMAVDADGQVYAGGNFTKTGTTDVVNLAVWNGDSWSPVSPVIEQSSIVRSLAVNPDGTTVYIAATSKILSLDTRTQTITPLGSGVVSGGLVANLAVAADGNVYMGGSFTSVGGVSAKGVAMWDGRFWKALGGGVDGQVKSIAIHRDGRVFVTGTFTSAGGVAANNIAVWNGSSWSAIASGLNGSGNAIAIDAADDLYVGGSFTQVGGMFSPFLARIRVW